MASSGPTGERPCPSYTGGPRAGHIFSPRLGFFFFFGWPLRLWRSTSMVHLNHHRLQRLREACGSSTTFPQCHSSTSPLSVSLLQSQSLPSRSPSACPMAHTAAPAGSRSSTRTAGERYATTTGTCRMPAWCAGSWTVAQRCQPAGPSMSGRGPVPSGWTTSTARGRRSPCLTAGQKAGEGTTATTGKMPAWCAQVMPFIWCGCPPSLPEAGGKSGSLMATN